MLPLIVWTWYERWLTRYHLGRLDSRLLRDIGYDEERAETQVNGPFWRALDIEESAAPTSVAPSASVGAQATCAPVDNALRHNS